MLTHLLKILSKIPLGYWLMGFATGCMFQYMAWDQRHMENELEIVRKEMADLRQSLRNTNKQVYLLVRDIRAGLGILEDTGGKKVGRSSNVRSRKGKN